MAAPADLPNIPGFRPNRIARDAKKKTGFKMVHGVAMEPPQPLDPDTVAAATARAVDRARSTASFNASISQSFAPSASVTATAQWLDCAGQVLQFDCYFNEAVSFSPDEDYRVRTCSLFYYLADDTIEVVEKKSENSGMPQGGLVQRHQVPRADGSGRVAIDDIVVGGSLTLYSREFFVTDCNASTRAYLEARGVEVDPAVEAPADPYSTLRADFMSRETGADQTVPRNQLKSPIKKFMEATLGNTIDTSGLEGFLKYDRVVLRFDALWDDSTSLAGDVMRYTIHYFLADDTVEVCEFHSNNDGRDPYPLLVKRMKLPVRFEVDDCNGRADEAAPDEYVNWRDLSVGGTLNIYGREVLLVDADSMTRAFYEEQGQPLAPRVATQFDKKPEAVEREVPPYNGWGSEADSLAGTKSLIPKAPKTVFDLKGAEINRAVLRFQARLVTDVADDKLRIFVISFYCADETIMVTEPPQRNTGIIGGRFLERGPYKSPSGVLFTPKDFGVGMVVTLNHHMFTIEDVDDFTLRYMEGRPTEFPLSDAPKVLDGMRDMLEKESKTGSLTAVLSKYDTDGSGTITMDEFAAIVKKFDPDLPQQAVVTLMRFFDKNKDGEISIHEFAQALDPQLAKRKQSAGANMQEYQAALAATQAAKDAETRAEKVLYTFCLDLQNKGEELVRKLSGATNTAGDLLSKEEFKKAITYADTAETSDSVNINLHAEHADYVTNHFFSDSDTLTYSDFLMEAAKITEEMARKGRAEMTGGFSA